MVIMHFRMKLLLVMCKQRRLMSYIDTHKLWVTWKKHQFYHFSFQSSRRILVED
ncbi:hypothetical protein RchiOBHm_Chr1g0376411 [Rosa chinensis]|uniref:Uncharacterized protein n=1 Tax=Rosa chinensis TaxID=74649 RepID=A0A2P6SMU2_ROSCH|nr:hypothetical protein RchiOBHm_Chr1g0376411 [Rosa chinensis]